MTPTWTMRCQLLLFGLAATGAVAQAQGNDAGTVRERLDAPTTVVLENLPLEEAIHRVSEAAGVRIVIPSDVLALAPYGRHTVVQHVEFRATPLSHGLVDLLSPLGMTFRVAGDQVEVVQADAMRCLGRAPTWEELDTWVSLTALEPGARDADREALRKLLRFQVDGADAWTTLEAAIRKVGAGTGADVLSAACHELAWGWCFDGRSIVVSSAATALRRRLEMPISVRLSFRPLIEVLQAVGQEAGVAVRTEPGALKALPLQIQNNFSILAKDVPAEQVLERIAVETGLAYLVEPDGVVFFQVRGPSSGSQAEDEQQVGPQGRDPYVGKVVVPLPDGRTMEWFIRRSELPPDLQDMRRKDLEAAFAAIRARSDAR